MPNKTIIFIADQFAEEYGGGGELNNQEAIELLKGNGYDVVKRRASNASVDFLREKKNAFFILANFTHLTDAAKSYFCNLDYIIYEHDHKYVKSRTPADYPEFIAPPSEITNYDLYASAKSILVQSVLHKKIIESNLKLPNVINLGGNLWSLESLDKMRGISTFPKESKHAIMVSPFGHKNTIGAISYCVEKGFDYKLIENMPYYPFLEELGKCTAFVFFPQTPETLSRVVVEARMMGLNTHSSKLVGAMNEEWISLKGGALIDFMINKRTYIFETIKQCIN